MQSLDPGELKDFKSKYERFKTAFKEMLQMADTYQERIKFAFECNANIQVNITPSTIDNDELIMGHLIFNLDYIDFSLTTLALIALANFQNQVIEEFGGDFCEPTRIALKNLDKADLIDIEETDFSEYVLSLAYNNPDYRNQREIVYDLPMISYKLKRDLFAKASRISVDKDQIEKFIFEDEKMGIGNKIEIIRQNLGDKEELSAEARKAMKELVRVCRGQNEYQKRAVYKDLRKIVNSIASEMINDKSKTVADIVMIYPNLRVQNAFQRFRLDEMFKVYEVLEFYLKDLIMKDNLSPVFKQQIDNKDKNVRGIKKYFKELKLRHKERLIWLLSQFVLRTMESFNDNMAQMTVEDLILYSEIGDEYSTFAEKRGKKVCKYLNRLQISKLEAMYKNLAAEFDSARKSKS